MAEKGHPITQPIYLGIGSPMPTPRELTNSMFGKVDDAFSGRSLQFEEEVKVEKKKEAEEEAVKKTEEDKSEDTAASEEGKVEEEMKTEEVKTEEVKTEEVKTEEVKTEEVKTEEVKEDTETDKVVDLSCRGDAVSPAYLLYCFTIIPS